MQIVYAQEAFPTTVTKSLFLAGPTPRGEGESWRKAALEDLEKLGYDGVVFVPEPRDGVWSKDTYIEQVQWEEEGLHRADCIVFWVPRDVKGTHPKGTNAPMPALTTNDEWGVWKDSGKVVWGSPEWADSTSYQLHYAKELGVNVSKTLHQTLEAAVKWLGEGAYRGQGEATVPLFIWNREDFQKWYASQKASGNRLEGLRVSWTFFVGPKKDHLFFYSLHPKVRIAAEDRVKDNEVVILRPDISAVVLYTKESDLSDTRIALVKEFRTPVRNGESYVYELPGGSSLKPESDPRTTAASEVSEELGFDVNPERLQYFGHRQMGATMAAYHAHLFSAELTSDEMDTLAADTGVHGVESDSERTYVEVLTLSEILDNSLVDWPMLGLIFGSFGPVK